jgi:hypothetical protein
MKPLAGRLRYFQHSSLEPAGSFVGIRDGEYDGVPSVYHRENKRRNR